MDPSGATYRTPVIVGHRNELGGPCHTRGGRRETTQEVRGDPSAVSPGFHQDSSRGDRGPSCTSIFDVGTVLVWGLRSGKTTLRVRSQRVDVLSKTRKTPRESICTHPADESWTKEEVVEESEGRDWGICDSPLGPDPPFKFLSPPSGDLRLERGRE